MALRLVCPRIPFHSRVFAESGTEGEVPEPLPKSAPCLCPVGGEVEIVFKCLCPVQFNILSFKRDKAALTAQYAASHGAELEVEEEEEAFEEALSNVVEESMASGSQRVAERQRAAVLRAEERQRRADVAAEAAAADPSRQKPNQVIPAAVRT